MRVGYSYLFTIITIVFIFGCSSIGKDVISTPVTNSSDIDSTPSSILETSSGIGLFGAYNLEIASDWSSAELTPIRTAQLGEAYTVSGLPFFTMAPCPDCLKINSLGLDIDGNLLLGFSIKHPFPKGNPAEDPSATNRLDLDVFDLALFVEPHGFQPNEYFQIPVQDYDYTNVHNDSIANADGYSIELQHVINVFNILPYVICYENVENNRFEMGTDWTNFEVAFYPTDYLNFNLYLTMGYGASATRNQRLEPVYYVPEFNRKSAWKVDVGDQTWTENNPATVTIEIYDWNHGVPVDVGFPDPSKSNQLSALSDISDVSVEVRHMTSTLIEAVTTDTTTNGWDDPITYTATFSNENGLPSGKYSGLVKVTDTRIPPAGSSDGESDTMVHTPDGASLEWYEIREFATYQTFIATIEKAGYGTGWTKSWGGSNIDESYAVTTDDSGNVYIGGAFESNDFDSDPSSGSEIYTSNGKADAFLTKIDPNGNFIWARTWGGEESDGVSGVITDNSGNVYVTGVITNDVDLDPGPGEDWHYLVMHVNSDVFLSKFDSDGNYLWGHNWGGDGIYSCTPQTLYRDDRGHGIEFTQAGFIYVTGHFSGEDVDFDPGPGFEYCSSIQFDADPCSKWSHDCFVSKFDLNGNFQWVRTWGEKGYDASQDIVCDSSGNVITTGYFRHACDFDPGIGEDIQSVYPNGFMDIFISKLDSNGNYIWARTWGGDDGDDGRSIAIDSMDNINVTGYFQNTVDFDPGAGINEHTAVQERDIYLVQFDSSGVFQWVGTWGGEDLVYGGDDLGNSVAVNSSDNVFVTGSFRNVVDFNPDPAEDWHAAVGKYDDLFLSKFDSNGNFIWAQTWGGQRAECSGYAIDVDNSNRIYFSGLFIDKVNFEQGSGEDIHDGGDLQNIFLKQLIE